MRANRRRDFVAGTLLFLCGLGIAAEPQVWSGEDVEVVKEDYANHRMPANQDRITDNVWLTRGDDHGLFNATEEIDYLPQSPFGTEWAYGKAVDWQNLNFSGFRDWRRYPTYSIIGQDAVLHLIEADVYLDIKFTGWTSNAQGGGFSYERATEGVPGERVWTGPTTTFTKANYADIGLPANQDRIVDGVWITRADRRGLVNLAREATNDREGDYTGNPSPPTGTQWAFGTTADLADLVFVSWDEWVGDNPAETVGKSAVLHIVEEDVYIDIKVTTWNTGGGGGFSWERATEGTSGETAWTGPTTTFTRNDSVDWTQAANQDRITNSVWITRQNDNNGIFNILEEPSYSGQTAEPGSPCNTEWAYGPAANWPNLSFKRWADWHGGNPQSSVGQAAVVHLIRENVYLDIKFLSYSGGGTAGGFSYERSTEGVPGEQVWTGAQTTFTRPNNVDWRDPANQDRITRWTWLARQNTQGMFNASFEPNYDGSSFYTCLTEWAYGSAADWASLSFTDFRSFKQQPGGQIGFVGQNAVLHLLDLDVYLDVKFLSWTTQYNGGGFRWERATEGVPGEKVWTGPKITFTKSDGADVGLAANQDRITDNVWITRRDVAGLYNATRQPGFDVNWRDTGYQSPRGTEWAFGKASEWQSLNFFRWYPWLKRPRNGRIPDVVGNSAVLHLIEEDVYLDVKFTFWAASDSGGGFTYTRATEGVPGEKVWTGPSMVFTKINFAPPSESIDQISPTVWLTRDNNQGPYNALYESGWLEDLVSTVTKYQPPSGTEWAYGRAADWQSLQFRPWKEWHNNDPLSAINRPAVVHLIKDDIYLDITFTGWTSNDRGGGFSYVRASYKAPLGALKASGKVDFANAGKDTLKVKGEVGLPEDFSPEGEQFQLDAGGVVKTFTLDARGKGTTGDGNGTLSLKYNKKAGAWKFQANLGNGSFASSWTDEGMIEETLQIPVEMRIVVRVGGLDFAESGSFTWKARTGKSGAFK